MEKITKFVEIDNEIQKEILQFMKQNLMASNHSFSEAQAMENVSKRIVPDGLMNNGDYYLDEVGHVRRAPSGQENVRWAQIVPLRVLYLTKELNAGKDKMDTYDIRQDSFCLPSNYVDDHHFETKLEMTKGLNKMIAYSLHGIIYTLLHQYEPFLEFENIEENDVKETIAKYIFARINVKPTGGSSKSIDNEVLHEAEKYSSYTVKRIKNLHPKIIVCCGNQDDKNFILEDLLNKYGFHFEYTKIQGLWIDKKTGMIAIDTYHPSYTLYGYPEKKLYNDIVKPLYDYLKESPYKI